MGKKLVSDFCALLVIMMVLIMLAAPLILGVSRNLEHSATAKAEQHLAHIYDVDESQISTFLSTCISQTLFICYRWEKSFFAETPVGVFRGIVEFDYTEALVVASRLE